MTQDKSHVSVMGLLGASQHGLVFGKDSTFCGEECVVKKATKYEVDSAMKHLEYIAQYKGVRVGPSLSFL